VLAFFVIKIEQLRVFSQNSAAVRLAPSVSNLPAAGNSSVPNFQSSVLTGKLGTKNPDFGLKSVSEQADKPAFLTETHSQTEIPVTHSKEKTASILTETRIAHLHTWQLEGHSPVAGALTRDLCAPIVRATTPGTCQRQ
jgi:hypothetical protein